jgi:sulfur-carrier protein
MASLARLFSPRNMPTVHFTANLTRHVSCPTVHVDGATVAEVLEAVFEQNPRLRSYVLDEQGAVRKHMNVFVDGQQVRDRERLGDPVSAASEVYVMQALSGG